MMMRTRQVCKPIFSIEKKVDTPPKVQKTNEAVDIVVIDDKAEEPVTEIEFNFTCNKDKFTTPEKFWKFIDEIGWKDRSQGRNDYLFTGDLNQASLKSFQKHFWKYFNELKEVFEEKHIFDSLERELDDDDQNALISHIIAKGQIYYATIIKEPYFSGALVGRTHSDDDFDDFARHIQ
jgi:hypothetical protein